MRTEVKVAAISFALVLGACGKRQEQATGLSDDLKRDLEVASSSSGDLATAPRSYERTRFVSDVEMSRANKPAPRPVATKRHTAPVRRPERVSKPAADVVDEPTVASNEAPAPAPTPVASATTNPPEPTVIAQQPTEEPAPAPAPANGGRGDDGRSVGQGGIGERGHGGGLGGLLGGIIGAVVIRGGHGGVDKCDPRTDGRRRGGMMDRPDFGLPLPTGRPTFPTRMYTRL
ncbi:MAG: hypothetical protein DMD35_00175 [Gemmatimonadetes bacterium]|nr:MAG: hypothetical protein DMD35_00175 [Gemmatimonadota bacterium]